MAAARRAASSSAARLLNAIAVTVAGSTPPSSSQAIRATRVVVLPEPAGAMHRTGPGGAVAAARWSGASRSRSAAAEPATSAIRAGSHRPLHRQSPETGAGAHRVCRVTGALSPSFVNALPTARYRVRSTVVQCGPVEIAHASRAHTSFVPPERGGAL